MTDSINVNLNNLTDKERDKLLALVEKANGGKEFPACGEKYFTILPYGKVVGTTNDNSRIDREIVDLGNCFRTREEAKFESERLKVLHRMRKIAGDVVFKKEDMYDKIEHYTLMYGCSGRMSVESTIKEYYDTDTNRYIKGFIASEILFPNRSSAQRAIDEIGEDTLKKYYFRIVE